MIQIRAVGDLEAFDAMLKLSNSTINAGDQEEDQYLCKRTDNRY